jgi:hypothetical protein
MRYRSLNFSADMNRLVSLPFKKLAHFETPALNPSQFTFRRLDLIDKKC